MTGKSTRKKRRSKRREYSDELKAEAVQMMLDGHSAQSVSDNLGRSGTNVLYGWKNELLVVNRSSHLMNPNQLPNRSPKQLRRVERERDMTGEEIWKGRLGGTFGASPILVGERIYAINEKGRTFISKADPEKFVLVGTNQLGDHVMATPTICGRRIYMRAATDGASRQEIL